MLWKRFVKEYHGMGTEKLSKKEKRVITRDAIIFAFFVFLAFIFWYLNSLENVMEDDIKYPVSFINVPKQRAIPENPVNLNFNLKGPGYSILKLKVTGRKPPVVIDISIVDYKRVPESEDLYYLITSGLVKSFTVQLRSDCEITSINPDTLFFTMDKVIPDSVKITDTKKIAKKKEQASAN
jgi:hypothetical protein